jgi:hypothetical protein
MGGFGGGGFAGVGGGTKGTSFGGIGGFGGGGSAGIGGGLGIAGFNGSATGGTSGGFHGFAAGIDGFGGGLGVAGFNGAATGGTSGGFHGFTGFSGFSGSHDGGFSISGVTGHFSGISGFGGFQGGGFSIQGVSFNGGAFNGASLSGSFHGAINGGLGFTGAGFGSQRQGRKPPPRERAKEKLKKFEDLRELLEPSARDDYEKLVEEAEKTGKQGVDPLGKLLRNDTWKKSTEATDPRKGNSDGTSKPDSKGKLKDYEPAPRSDPPKNDAKRLPPTNRLLPEQRRLVPPR